MIEFGAKQMAGHTTIADSGYPGTGLITPDRRRKGEEPATSSRGGCSRAGGRTW